MIKNTLLFLLTVYFGLTFVSRHPDLVNSWLDYIKTMVEPFI